VVVHLIIIGEIHNQLQPVTIYTNCEIHNQLQPVTTYTNCLFTGEKDLPIKPNKEWSHMEKLEYDKLEWMEDLPPPSTDNKEVL
jgi:hypothetical protein